MRGGQQRTIQIEVSQAGDGAGEFLRRCRTAELVNVSCRAQVRHQAGRAIVTCDLTAGDRPGTISGRILLTLADHDQPVELEISGRIGEEGGELPAGATTQ